MNPEVDQRPTPSLDEALRWSDTLRPLAARHRATVREIDEAESGQELVELMSIVYSLRIAPARVLPHCLPKQRTAKQGLILSVHRRN